MKAMHCLTMAIVAATLGSTGLLAQALVAIIPAPPRVQPPPPPGYTYQWVPPVYRTVRDQVWIPEHVDMVRDWVEVAPGRYEMVMRQVIVPGHFEMTTRQVMVSDGYWRLVRIDPPPMPLPPRPVVVSPGTVGVEGYGQVPAEDLSKFSGLREWPAGK